jgi:hypothetical protein
VTGVKRNCHGFDAGGPLPGLEPREVVKIEGVLSALIDQAISDKTITDPRELARMALLGRSASIQSRLGPVFSELATNLLAKRAGPL